MAKKLTDKQKGMLGSAATGLSSGIALGTSLAQIEDTSGQEASIEGVGSTQFAEGDTNTLMASFDINNMARTNYTADEIRGFTPGQMAGNILASTASGALSGAMKGGLVGALIEGGSNLVGGTIGALAGNAKAQKRAAELNSLAEENNKLYLNNFANAASNAQNKMFNNSLLNIAAYGGPLFNHGGDWSNGLTFINEGGTHEQNPLGGVPVGVDQEGTPNLVEEGEIIWNDYVFSNRLKPTKKQLETIGFDPKYEGYTFAKIVEDVQKASAENPLDKISTDTLNENLMYLMTMQEEIRMKKQAKQTNKFAKGGKVNILDGTANSQSLLGLFPLDENIVVEDTPIKIEDVGIDTNYNLPKPIFMGVDAQGHPYAMSKEDFNAAITKGTAKVAEGSVLDAYKTKNNIGNTKNPFVNAGTLAPLISSAGQLIYNTLKPIDKSNVIAAKAYSKVPMMSLPRIGGKKTFTPTDKNRYIAPIEAQGRAAARTYQNMGINPSQVAGNLLASNYNTQKAISEALSTVEQSDLAREMQIAQFNLGIDQANMSASQAEQAANMAQANRLAMAEIQDAQTIETLGQLKGQAINASLNNLTKGIADLATQGINWNLIKDIPVYADAIKHLYGNQAKCGGMLTRKKRRK